MSRSTTASRSPASPGLRDTACRSDAPRRGEAGRCSRDASRTRTARRRRSRRTAAIATPTRDARASTGQHRRAESGCRARRSPLASTTATKTTKREQHRHRREREEDAGGRRDALPAPAELEKDRTHVADDRRDADRAIAQHRSGSRALTMRGGSNSTGSAPFAASAKRRPRRRSSSRARGTTFVAPRLPEPCLRRSTPRSLPAMVRRRDRAEQIRERERDRRRHAGRTLTPLLRRSRMRSGLPVKPHDSRKPLCRKRT